MDIAAEVAQLKREKDAVILAHYYVPSETQALADYVGDSFYLARLARSRIDLGQMAFLEHRVDERGGWHDIADAPRLDIPNEMPLYLRISSLLRHELVGAVLTERRCAGSDGVRDRRYVHGLRHCEQLHLGRVSPRRTANLVDLSAHMRVSFWNSHTTLLSDIFSNVIPHGVIKAPGTGPSLWSPASAVKLDGLRTPMGAANPDVLEARG